MGDLNIQNIGIDEKEPFQMMTNIAVIKEIVLASSSDITLRFGNKYICPLFALIIKVLADELREDDVTPRRLLFKLSDLYKNPEMVSFLFESGLFSSFNPDSKAIIEQQYKHDKRYLRSIQSIQNERMLAPHDIDLATLKALSETDQTKKIIKEVFGVFSALRPVVMSSDYDGLVSKLVELFYNVIYHSQSDKKAYSMAVQLRSGGYMVAIYDLGIGIPGAYDNYRRAVESRLCLPQKTDFEAIRWAMQDGTSTLQVDRNYPRGAGLSGIKEFVNNYNGRIVVASNGGYYCYENNTEKGGPLMRKIRGTLIMMDFPKLQTT